MHPQIFCIIQLYSIQGCFMKREYWNGLSDKYEDEIFSVLENDKRKLICGLIEKYGSSSKTVNDFGCGIGHLLGILAKNFQQVNAIDISYKFIARAKKRYKHLSNIEYTVADLADNALEFPKTHFGMSVNLLIMPSHSVRIKIFDSMIKHIRKNGHLLMVVPSIESVMLTNYMLAQWNLRDGINPIKAYSANFTSPETYSKNLCHGIVPIDGVPTKHYLKEELEAMMVENKMKIINMQKIEYKWDTEFAAPPKWMKAPYPWDWLILSQKR
ncbi:MAG: class I SAM-dependent methyltransferase [Planctomycetaceae bacterium]|nr:class I SAM-dependent methyltransferase [Planctomycetaceae bacterium]